MFIHALTSIRSLSMPSDLWNSSRHSNTSTFLNRYLIWGTVGLGDRGTRTRSLASRSTLYGFEEDSRTYKGVQDDYHGENCHQGDIQRAETEAIDVPYQFFVVWYRIYACNFCVCSNPTMIYRNRFRPM